MPHFSLLNTNDIPQKHKTHPLKEQSSNELDGQCTQKIKIERVPSAKITLPLHQQLDSEAVKYFGESLKKIKK